MRQAYGLIAVLLATTAVVAIVLHNTNRAAEHRSVPQAALTEGAAGPAVAPSPAPASEAPIVTAEPTASPVAGEMPAPSAPPQAEMADLQAALAEREAERDRLSASLGETESVLAARDAQVQEIEAQLVARTAEVRVLEAEIAVLSARSSFEAQLDQSRASRALYPVARPAAGGTDDSLEAALIDRKGPPPNPEALTTAALSAMSEAASEAVESPPSQPQPTAMPSVFAAIHFETASADLTPGGRERVRAAAAALTGVPIAGVDVVGYTDTVGSREANHRLATRRADSVAVALAEAGLSRELIIASGLGEEGAPVATARGVSEPLNRSVEIVVRPASSQP